MSYTSPVAEFRFLFDHVLGYGRLSQTDLFAEAGNDVTEAILTELGRLCDGVMAPLNRGGDLTPAVLENGVVRTSPGFKDGYQAIAEGGWLGLGANPEYGGMGLPQTLNTAMNEMMSGACLALQLCPLLSQGQIEALEHHASDAIKDLYLPKLTSGQWTGTMNLTEPQAGSDVGALRSKAVPNGDGSYSVTGQKIFITWGDHDVAENVCHLVLARLPDGAPGTRGISLFMVPKLIPDDAGNPGERNSLRVVSLEHKLGIHGSPTCVMSFEGARGWLVGHENGGMAAMFTMMNNARLGVGAQGIGVAEAAYQHALAYAQDRKQGKTPLGEGAIIDHADVRRMLAMMKAEVFAARAIALACGLAMDMGRATGDAHWTARAALLTPIAKAHGTDIGCEVSSMGVQIHGGMGFIEETGAAQYFRDARITPIYEGTNGIQAADLVTRKLGMDGGAALTTFLETIARESAHEADLFALIGDCAAVAHWMREEASLDDRLAGSVPFCNMMAVAVSGWQLNRQLAVVAAGEPSDPGDAKRVAVRFFLDRIVPEARGLKASATGGAAALYELSADQLVG